MPYAVVEFSDNEIGTVALKWFTPEKTQVYWPPYKDNYYFRKSLRREEEPNENTWPLYPVKKCHYETDDLDKALNKQQDAEITSNLSSDDDIIQNARKRKPPRRYMSDSESGDEHDTEIKRPPRIKSNIAKRHCEGKNVMVCSQPTPRPATPNQTHIIKNSFSSQPLSSNITSLDKPHPEDKNVATSSKEVRNISLCPASSETNEVTVIRSSKDAAHISKNEYSSLLQHLVTIEEQNKQILGILRRQNLLEKIIDGDPKLVEKLPLKTIDEVNEFETTLSSNETVQSLVSYLSQLGGEEVVSRTNKILRNLLTDDLASGYNFCGHHSKEAFNRLKLKNIIIQSVKCKHQAASVHEIEQAIKNWLKYAPKRIQIATKKDNRD